MFLLAWLGLVWLQQDIETAESLDSLSYLFSTCIHTPPVFFFLKQKSEEKKQHLFCMMISFRWTWKLEIGVLGERGVKSSFADIVVFIYLIDIKIFMVFQTCPHT